MTKLTRLKINKFRNVEPVELKFSNGLNVLLGINGSGKTTFLELIAAILRQNISKYRDEVIDVEYDLSIADGTIRVHLTNQPVRWDNSDDVQHRISARRTKTDSAVQAEVTIDISRSFLVFVVSASRIAITVTTRDRSGNDGPHFTNNSSFPLLGEEFLDCIFDFIKNTGQPWLNLDTKLHSLIDKFRSASRFDESLNYWDSILRTSDSDTTDWINVSTDDSAPPFDLLFDDRSALAPSLISALTDAVNESATNWRGSEQVKLSAAKLPFLREMADLANINDAWLELRLVEKGFHQRGELEFTDFYFGMPRFWFKKLDGSIIPDQKLSYGQKRLLSFFYYLDCNPTIVIADELAAGLHHAWISACLEAIGDRQAFLASHDPILIDEIDLGSIEDVERSFLLCRCDTSSGKERLSWSNMSRHDAERFFEAYNVGLQHVSEILRTKRLW